MLGSRGIIYNLHLDTMSKVPCFQEADIKYHAISASDRNDFWCFKEKWDLHSFWICKRDNMTFFSNVSGNIIQAITPDF